MTKNAIGYVRISVDRDNETSIASQERAVREYAKSKGWTLVGIEVDRGKSAYSGKSRSGLDRALTAIRTGAADTLIVWKLDRLVRSVRQFAEILDRLEESDAEFVSITDNFDTTSAMGEAMLNIAVVMAQLESAIKSERTTAWHGQRQHHRLPPTGPPVLGYIRPEGGEFGIDPEAAPKVRQAVGMILDGVSVNKSSQVLDSCRQRLTKSLKSPTLAGLLNVGTKEEPKFVEGDWEPLLDRPTWDRLQAMLADPTRRTTTSNHRVHLLAGIVVCGECDTPMKSRKVGADDARYRCPQCHSGTRTGPIDELFTTALL
jgi:site-specific DNA recombinase